MNTDWRKVDTTEHSALVNLWWIFFLLRRTGSIYVSDNILKPALVSKSESTVFLSNSIARTGMFKEFASTRHTCDFRVYHVWNHTYHFLVGIGCQQVSTRHTPWGYPWSRRWSNLTSDAIGNGGMGHVPLQR